MKKLIKKFTAHANTVNGDMNWRNATACAEITKKIAIKFYDWMGEEKYGEYKHEGLYTRWDDPHDNYEKEKTLDELFTLFIVQLT